MIGMQIGIMPPAEPEPEGEGWSQPLKLDRGSTPAVFLPGDAVDGIS